jgi:hypothetical protein
VLILSALSRILCIIPQASVTLEHISTIRSPFSHHIITLNFSSIPIAFRQFFTRISLGNADLHFSHILVRKANAVEEKTK